MKRKKYPSKHEEEDEETSPKAKSSKRKKSREDFEDVDQEQDTDQPPEEEEPEDDEDEDNYAVYDDDESTDGQNPYIDLNPQDKLEREINDETGMTLSPAQASINPKYHRLKKNGIAEGYIVTKAGGRGVLYLTRNKKFGPGPELANVFKSKILAGIYARQMKGEVQTINENIDGLIGRAMNRGLSRGLSSAKKSIQQRFSRNSEHEDSYTSPPARRRAPRNSAPQQSSVDWKQRYHDEYNAHQYSRYAQLASNSKRNNPDLYRRLKSKADFHGRYLQSRGVELPDAPRAIKPKRTKGLKPPPALAKGGSLIGHLSSKEKLKMDYDQFKKKIDPNKPLSSRDRQGFNYYARNAMGARTPGVDPVGDLKAIRDKIRERRRNNLSESWNVNKRARTMSKQQLNELFFRKKKSAPVQQPRPFDPHPPVPFGVHKDRLGDIRKGQAEAASKRMTSNMYSRDERRKTMEAERDKRFAGARAHAETKLKQGMAQAGREGKAAYFDKVKERNAAKVQAKQEEMRAKREGAKRTAQKQLLHRAYSAKLTKGLASAGHNAVNAAASQKISSLSGPTKKRGFFSRMLHRESIESPRIKHIVDNKPHEFRDLNEARAFHLDTLNRSNFKPSFSDTRALQHKATENEVPFAIVEEVYNRGILDWIEEGVANRSPSQHAFNRVNSFLSGGRAAELDYDLYELLE